jgi:NAD+-dependent protein deacetylase sirtuin 4
VIDDLVDLVRGKRVAVLTGAGCSTESGIPDYRGPGTRDRARNPIQHRAFVSDPIARARYWARSAVGWSRFRNVEPNAAHRALASMELTGLITQNVDRLHHRAGSRDVIELHGALAEVRCLACESREDRDALQARILELNPGFVVSDAELAPDGDSELDAVQNFRVPPCLACGGVLKPDVVFFGDNVPRPRVEAAFALADAADVLLVVGSSLTVFSGYRFVLRAAERGQKIAIVNLGETRGDPHAHVRVDARAGEVLPVLAQRARLDAGSARPIHNENSP